MLVTIYPSDINGTITVPPSKSYAQRAIAAAMLAQGTSQLTNIGDCDDTKAMLEAAQKLGAVVIESMGLTTISGGYAPRGTILNIGESALAARMLTPIAALSDEKITITGRGTILNRPIINIINPLEQLGVSITTSNGTLPLTIQGPLCGGNATVDGSGGSQFVSGLLFALPLTNVDSQLEVTDIQSRPYIEMTLDVLAKFGVTIQQEHSRFYIQGNQHYTPADFAVEGDWSGASCLLVAGAVAGAVTVTNLNSRSLQADRQILEALSDAGAELRWQGDSLTVQRAPLKRFTFDATHCPDLFPALAALAAHCQGVSTIVGTNRLRHKESDRAATLAMEFAKLGINVDLSEANVMKIHGSNSRKSTANQHSTLESHGDHRIAMSLAVMALTCSSSMIIDGAEAVSKSYPEFWETFNELQKQNNNAN